MVKYILKPGAEPKLTDDQIQAARALLGNNGKFLTNNNFNEKQLWEIAKVVFRLKTNGGSIISFLDAQRIMNRFNDNPNMLLASKANVDLFREKVALIEANPKAIPQGYQLGLRFYVGKDDQNSYGAVIVPVCGPIPPPGAPIQHELELEKTLFLRAETDFFGLAPSTSELPGNGSIVNQAHAAAITRIKDGSGVEMIYFLHSTFIDFITKLGKEYSRMLVTFGRNEPGRLTVVVMFLDAQDNPISYSDQAVPFDITGICFDQGDLMPPPDVPDRSI